MAVILLSVGSVADILVAIRWQIRARSVYDLRWNSMTNGLEAFRIYFIVHSRVSEWACV